MYEPVARHRPAHRWTDGDLAAQVGADLGLVPDAEQQWLLDSIFAERAPDLPASFEVAVVAPRQNLKSATLEIAALTDAFVKKVPLHVWTAHELDTAQKSFQDMKSRIMRNPEYADRAKFMSGHQDMSITVDNGDAPDSVIEFEARSGRSGRGWTCDRLTLDEALFLKPNDLGAILPTLVTRGDAQVRYGSSAGLEISAALRGIRDRGRGGKDPRLAYVEYGAPRRACAAADCSHRFGEVEGCAADDRELWWAGNCALWAGRITEDALEDQRRALPPAEFMREFYSWWEDPVSVGGALPYGLWMELADPDAPRGSSPVFGVDVAEDRSAWIAVLWERADGNVQAMLANDGAPVPAHRIVTEVARLSSEWDAQVVPPKQLVADLDEEGVLMLPMVPGGFPEACAAVADGVKGRTVRHGNQPALNDAVRVAEWRSAGALGERAFKLNGCPKAGPLAAVARALWGINEQANYNVEDSVL